MKTVEKNLLAEQAAEAEVSAQQTAAGADMVARNLLPPCDMTDFTPGAVRRVLTTDTAPVYQVDVDIFSVHADSRVSFDQPLVIPAAEGGEELHISLRVVPSSLTAEPAQTPVAATCQLDETTLDTYRDRAFFCGEVIDSTAPGGRRTIKKPIPLLGLYVRQPGILDPLPPTETTPSVG